MNHYETVFILIPFYLKIIKEAVQKYADIITSNSGELVNKENWGLKNLLHHPKQKSGFTTFLILS